MYKTLTEENWRTILNYPNDYKVDSVLIAGTPKVEKHLTFIKESLEELKYKYELTKIENKHFVRSYEIKINNKTIWFDTSYGSAYLSEVVHIGSILGSKCNLLVGSCGGLNIEANALDIIIPNFSYSSESTTKMYQRQETDNKHFPDKKLSEELSKVFAQNYKVFNKPIVTCQAHLGETAEDITNWNNIGFYGVEMESASMFAVSNYFKVPSSAVIHIVDNLIKNDHMGSEATNSLREKRDQLSKDKYKLLFSYLINTI